MRYSLQTFIVTDMESSRMSEKRDEFWSRSGAVRLPDEFREPAVGDLARAIRDGLVEGGLSTHAIQRLACALLAIASRGTDRESGLPPAPRGGRADLR